MVAAGRVGRVFLPSPPLRGRGSPIFLPSPPALRGRGVGVEGERSEKSPLTPGPAPPKRGRGEKDKSSLALRFMSNMHITFDCTACGRNLRVPESLAGKKARCPHCQGVVAVPES